MSDPRSGIRASVLNPLTGTIYIFGGSKYEVGTPAEIYTFNQTSWALVTPDPVFPTPSQRYMGAAIWYTAMQTV